MAASRANQFGRLIRERRRLLNLTQEELARRIRVSMPFVGHLETGHRRTSEKRLPSSHKYLDWISANCSCLRIQAHETS